MLSPLFFAFSVLLKAADLAGSVTRTGSIIDYDSDITSPTDQSLVYSNYVVDRTIGSCAQVAEKHGHNCGKHKGGKCLDVDMDSTTTNNDGAATTSRLKPSSFWREDVYDQLLASVAKPSSEEYQRLDLISNEVERERVVREMLLIPREQELNPTQIEEWSRTMKQLHLDLPRNRLITGCVTPERLVSLCTAASVHNPTAGYMQGMDGKELKFCLLFCLCVRCRVAMWINIFLFILHSSFFLFILHSFASFCSISSNTITTFK